MFSKNNLDEKAKKIVYHYFSIDKPLKAKEILIDLLTKQPEDPELHYLYGTCLYCLKQGEQALEEFSFSIKQGYEVDFCYYFMGLIYKNQENYLDSESCFLAALEIDPNNYNVLGAYGLLMIKTGFSEKGFSLLEEALKIAPNDEELLRYKLYLELAKTKNNSIIIGLEDYLSNCNSLNNTLTVLSVTNFIKKDLKSARENLRELFLLDPTDDKTLEVLEELEQLYHPLFIPNRLIAKFLDFPQFIAILLGTILFGVGLILWGGESEPIGSLATIPVTIAVLLILTIIGLGFYTIFAEIVYKGLVSLRRSIWRRS